MKSLDLATRRLGGALAQFWSGGSGPNRQRILSALAIAGYSGPDEGNKQQLVLNSVLKAENEQTARSIIEELIGLLRESGYFDEGYDDPNVVRLRSLSAQVGHYLDSAGFLTWDAHNKPTQATPRASPTAALTSLTSPEHVERDSVEPSYEVTEPNIALLLSSLRRVGNGAARSLVIRRQHRHGLQVEDEYDLQDVVEFLLKSLYNDVRREEPTPSSGGSSSRVDLHLRQGRIAVEVKVTRAGRGAKQIKTELVSDIHDYRTHPSVTKLIAVIYDLMGTFDNPVGFEHDLSSERDGLDVHVIVVPWVGPRTRETDGSEHEC